MITWNRERLIAYLLHQIPDEERAALEDRWINDPDLHEQLSAVEAELLDAYVRENLSASQRMAVEAHLLGSNAQRRKLEFARALQTAVSTPKRGFRSWAAWAAVAACLVLGATAAWFGWQNLVLRREVKSLSVGPRPVVGQTYAALLTPDTTRGGSAPSEIRPAKGTEAIRLDLEIDPDDERQNYKATVFSAADSVVWTEEPIQPAPRASRFVASVWIPMRVLTAGKFRIELSSAGRVVDYYFFRTTDAVTESPAR